MNTTVKPLSKSLSSSKVPGIVAQVLMRKTPLKDWLTNPILKERLSGTLRKSNNIGFNVSLQLEHEAICQTLGWGFESIITTRLNYNTAISEGDCPAITEVGWHFDRMKTIHLFSEDYFELKYIILQDEAGNLQRQGIGIIMRETSVQWVKKGKMIFAMLTEYSLEKKEWSDCVNPF